MTTHDFFVSDDLDQVLNNRWWRKDGYAIMRNDWYMGTPSKEFDLLRLQNLWECVKFDPVDMPSIKFSREYIYHNSDILPKQVKLLVEKFCESQFYDVEREKNVLHPTLAYIISKIDQ